MRVINSCVPSRNKRLPPIIRFSSILKAAHHPTSTAGGIHCPLHMTSNDVDTEPSLTSKYVYTGAASLCQLVYGLMYEITGATLADMADQTSSTFYTASYAITVRTIGYLIGSLASGWAYNKINRQVGYILALITSAAVSLCIPFETHISTYFFSLFITGICGSAMDVAGNAWILEIWQASANPYMQAQLVSYAIGQALIPFISAPFLSDGVNKTKAFQLSLDMLDFPANESKIIVPYTMAAVFGFLGAALLLGLYLIMPYQHVTRSIVKQKVAPLAESENQSGGSLDAAGGKPDRYHKTVVLLGCLLLCVYNGIELNCLNFVPTYVENLSLPVSKSKAAIMLSSLSAAYATSRAVCFFVGSRVSANQIVYFNMVLIGIGNSMLYAASNHSEPMIWLSMMMIGFGFGSTFPAILSLVEERINVTNQLSGWLMFSSNVSVIVNSLLVGRLIQSMPQVFIYINVGSLSVCCIILVALYFNETRPRTDHKAIE